MNILSYLKGNKVSDRERNEAASESNTDVFFDVVSQSVLRCIKDKPTTLEMFGGFSAFPQISLSAATEVRMF